jgi:cysteine desulfurase
MTGKNEVTEPFIYLDNASTTRVDERIVPLINEFMTGSYGNSNSVDHDLGTAADRAVWEAKEKIGRLVGCNPQRIIFTSGSTEGINTVLLGFQSFKNRKINIGVSRLEHKAVLATCEYLEGKGLASLVWLDSDANGNIDLKTFERRILDHKLDLLVVMAVNNEIGLINPLEEIASIAKRNSVPLFSDATQGVGKIPVDFRGLDLDFLVFSSHKIYGPKGVGALVVKDKNTLNPLIHGGGQQNNLRSGTMNVPGVVGFGEACRLRFEEMAEDETRIGALKDKLKKLIESAEINVVLLGSATKAAGFLPVSFPGIPNKAIISRLRNRIAISTGAACSSGVEAPSHVLTAMKLPTPVVEGFLRISLGKFNTDLEISSFAELLISTVKDIKKCL